MWTVILASVLKVDNLPQSAADDDAINRVLGVVFAVTGSIALLVITVAGFRYVVSHGDPNQIAQAKNALLYAIIGLVISLVAFSIVTFVVGNL